MPKKNFLKDLASELTNSLPTHLSSLKKDFEKSFHNVLHQAFTKFDLVTREEFDIQTKVLARSRKKLEELEKHIKNLEARLKKKREK